MHGHHRSSAASASRLGPHCSEVSASSFIYTDRSKAKFNNDYSPARHCRTEVRLLSTDLLDLKRHTLLSPQRGRVHMQDMHCRHAVFHCSFGLEEVQEAAGSTGQHAHCNMHLSLLWVQMIAASTDREARSSLRTLCWCTCASRRCLWARHRPGGNWRSAACAGVGP